VSLKTKSEGINRYTQFCTEQIRRFASQREWPDPDKYPEAVQDLVKELERVSRGDTRFAVRLVDTCKRGSEFCPRVNDIASVAAELRESDAASGPSQEDQWRKAGLSPIPFDFPDDFWERNRKAQEARREMHKKVYAALGATTAQQIGRLSLHSILSKQQELGYPLTFEQQHFIG
jgi:hypothetical protein